MKDELVKKAKETHRLHLTFWEAETHYGIVIIFAIAPLILVFSIAKKLITGVGKIAHPDFYYVVLISILLGIIAFVIQYRRLAFTRLSTKLSRDQIQKQIEEISTEGNWSIVHSGESVIVIKTNPKFSSGSWGEQITVRFDDDEILINSICDPDKPSSVTSFGRNTAIIELLKKRLNQPAANKAYNQWPGSV